MIRLCHMTTGSPTRCADLEAAIARHDGQVMETFLDQPEVRAAWREKPWVLDALTTCLETGHAAEIEMAQGEGRGW